ncbi:Lecithin:cholesterol acyltransferase-domain-containing protein [Pilobolus umbonatus]|nr:Lecithin:cholesterol acyltransferase-domain-containing protein [Pilobolus umbonatus]
MSTIRKRRTFSLPTSALRALVSTPTMVKMSDNESPEDILADCILFKQHSPPVWKRKRFHFIIGLSVGLLAAYGASTTPTAQTHFNGLQSYIALQIADMDLAKIIPASDMVDDIFGNLTNFFTPTTLNDHSFMPALALRDHMNLKPHFPVVIIPGIISTGLESWGTSDKSRKFFRKRMWGTTTMLRSVLLDKELWTQHLKLDPLTGLDPPDIKIRAAQGLDAADYFITGYWIWAKIIENLAMIGYDNNNMHLASYDWRLSFSNLEVRDGYFSKLKSVIEISRKNHNKRTVVLAHSMGSSLFPYFLRWAESPEGGDGGTNWTENHIETFVNIAGPMIGVPKALTAMLSGETRDTMNLGSFGAYLLEKFFSRRERASLLRTWAGGSSMLPKGGDALWGRNEASPDDGVNSKHHSYGNIISFTKRNPHGNSGEVDSNTTEKVIDKDNSQNFSLEDSLDLLYNTANPEYAQMLNSNYSLGISMSKKQLEMNNKNPKKWSNPLESQLPIAPSMKIFCMYGIGLPTERSYYYTREKDEPAVMIANDIPVYLNTTEINEGVLLQGIVKEDRVDSELVQSPLVYIDAGMNDPTTNVESGVRFTNGDGTVPLLSLGFMCAPSGGWRKYGDLYNPGHSPVQIKEYVHEQSESKLDVRGGCKTGDHVDILGNWEMTLDILQIVSNKGYNVTERILSNIETYVSKVKIEPQS